MMEEVNGERGPLRVCVIGAGAMGGLIGAHLLESGVEVTLVDKGARAAQLRRDGLKLITPAGETRSHTGVRVLESAEAGAGYDIVVLAVKTYDLSDAARGLGAAIAPDAAIVTVQNGIPWWYFHRQGGQLDGLRLATVDPDGALAKD